MNNFFKLILNSFMTINKYTLFNICFMFKEHYLNMYLNFFKNIFDFKIVFDFKVNLNCLANLLIMILNYYLIFNNIYYYDFFISLISSSIKSTILKSL